MPRQLQPSVIEVVWSLTEDEIIGELYYRLVVRPTDGKPAMMRADFDAGMNKLTLAEKRNLLARTITAHRTVSATTRATKYIRQPAATPTDLWICGSVELKIKWILDRIIR